MARSYDSTRRKQQAQQTRRRILDAAVALHSRGITAYEPLAEAAGVPMATLRKHFPNREELFFGCTQHFFQSFEVPALEAAARLKDPAARLAMVAGEMCRAHDATHDLVWHTASLAAESDAVAAALNGLSAMVEQAVAVLVDGPGLGLRGSARTLARARVRALLDPLTYRAFRVHAGLDAAATQRALTMLLGSTVGIQVPES